MYTYTTFAAYFEDQFFSPDDPHKSIYIYAIFWATFIMRPFGSWFFGRWADRHGRRSALIMAVTIMAVGSLVISVLPTRGTIGVGPRSCCSSVVSCKDSPQEVSTAPRPPTCQKPPPRDTAVSSPRSSTSPSWVV
ncbi:hypothetical protein HMPREF9344_00137 [Cutibacterium acnes HL097PA1]|nr:hypothetical protein HMPREF9344_00137 [Cutibacterium acnes HL097PA1]